MLGDFTPPDGLSAILKEYLERIFTQVKNELLNSNQIPRLTLMPKKLSDGKIYYFSNAVAPDITAAGYWGRVEGRWVYMGADRSVFAAYGGISQQVTASMPNTDGTWYVIPFSTELLASPLYITQDPSNNSIVLPGVGTYEVTAYATIHHNELNSNRILAFRIYDPVESIASTTIYVGTGRNSTPSTLAPSILFEVTDANPTPTLQLQMMSTDIYTNVTIEKAALYAKHISPYKI